MKSGASERCAPMVGAAACAARLFDALTLKPCNLELARALHSAGHARHDFVRDPGEGDLVGLIAGLKRDGGDLRIEPVGDAPNHRAEDFPAENFVVSLRRRCHRVLELARIDIYRIAGGRIAEHWQVMQPAGAVLAKAIAPVRAPAARNFTSQAHQKHPGQPDMRRV